MKFDMFTLFIIFCFFPAFAKPIFSPSHLMMTLGPQRQNIVLLACPSLPDSPTTRFYDYTLASPLKNSHSSDCHILLGDPLFETRIILENKDFRGANVHALARSFGSLTLGSIGLLNVIRILGESVKDSNISHFDNFRTFMVFGVLAFIVTGQALMSANAVSQFFEEEDKKKFANMVATIETMVDGFFLSSAKISKKYQDLVIQENHIAARGLYNSYYSRVWNTLIGPQVFNPSFLQNVQTFNLDQSPTYKSIPTGRGIL
jgi:hypothetical protein